MLFRSSEDSQARLDKNPLRILDSKDPRDRPFADSAPPMVLSAEAEDFFGQVRSGLDAAGVAYEIAPHLVRGLDYYRHTAFEFVTDQLGAQGTVIAGGRYDGLIEQLGGPHTPAVGWAAGIERLAMLIDAPGTLENPTIAVIPETPEASLEAYAITVALRSSGMNTQFALRGNSKRRAELAAKEGAEAILFVRAGEASQEKLKLVHGSRDSERATQLLLNVLGRLPDKYASMSGHDDVEFASSQGESK